MASKNGSKNNLKITFPSNTSPKSQRLFTRVDIDDYREHAIKNKMHARKGVINTYLQKIIMLDFNPQ